MLMDVSLLFRDFFFVSMMDVSLLRPIYVNKMSLYIFFFVVEEDLCTFLLKKSI